VPLSVVSVPVVVSLTASAVIFVTWLWQNLATWMEQPVLLSGKR
jgi:hypothetical protein